MLKPRFVSALVSLTFLLAASPAALAGEGGTGVRGGGSVLKLENDYALSEVFLLKGAPGARLKLSKEMMDLFAQIRILVREYTGADLHRYWEEVYGALADYRVVAKLPCLEKDDSAPEVLGRDSRYVACTVNGVTYVNGELFGKLDTKLKVISLLHERAHVFDVAGDSHERWIYPFVQGVYVLLTVRLEQEKQAFRALEPYELRALRGLLETGRIYARLKETSRDPGPGGYLLVTPQGGGKLYFDSEADSRALRIDAESFVSVDSRVDFSRVRCNIDVKKNPAPSLTRSRILNSRVSCASLADSGVRNSILANFSWYYGDWARYSYAMVDESTLQIAGHPIGVTRTQVARSFIAHDTYDVEVRIADSRFADSKIDYTGIGEYYMCCGGTGLDGELLMKVVGGDIAGGLNKNRSKRRQEGVPLTAKRMNTAYHEIRIQNALGYESLWKRVRNKFRPPKGVF